MSDREHMGTEQAEGEWNGRRETLYDPPPSRGLSVAVGFVMVGVLAFAAGVALQDEMHDRQKIDEAARFAAKVKACELDPNAGTAVARQDGKIECHALMPRVYLPKWKPTRRELRRILTNYSKGSQ